MPLAKVFGVPIEQLDEMAARHMPALAASETLILGPLSNDDRVDPEQMIAFMKWRAIKQLVAIVEGDVDLLVATLGEARELARAGRL